MKRNVIIIGSGPAGYTAAIYASRAGLAPLVFEGIVAGGQLMLTTDVENYPGFPEGVTGDEMMEMFRKQAERFGSELIRDVVTKVDLSAPPFKVWRNEELYEADAVIVATGASAKWIGLESEQALLNHGVSACATCDGFFFRGKEIVVVGGGDTAMEEATFLTRFATKVTVVHRRHELRASKIMQDRAFKNPKIEFIWDSVIEEVLGVDVGHVTGVRLRNLKTAAVTDFPTEGLFLAIGHKPNSDLFTGQLKLDEQGYVLIHEGSKTNVTGVFAAGDIADTVYRQAVTAAGMGCMAAIDAERYLESLGH